MSGFFKDSELIAPAKAPPILPRCDKCRLYQACSSPKMKVDGEGKRKILIVGEAPGEEEDKLGRPFVGRAGQYLQRAVESLGFDLRRDCHLTNALICRPTDEQGRNRAPRDREIDYCAAHLHSTIRRLSANVIILLGNTAVRSVLSRFWHGRQLKISNWLGFCIPSIDLNSWICPTYHPSFCVRSESAVVDHLFLTHLRVAFEKTERPHRERPDYTKCVDVVLDAEIAARRVLDFCRSDMIAIDYETNCLKPDSAQAEIVSCAVSDGAQTISYPFYRQARAATRLLLRSQARKIASNAKFEERWSFKEFGHGVTNWFWDTMLASHVLDNRRNISSIKFQAFVRLGQSTYNHRVESLLSDSDSKGLGGNALNKIRDIDTRTLLLYGGMDALLEYEVASHQMRELEQRAQHFNKES